MLQAKSIRILLGFALLFLAVQYSTKSVSGKVQIQVLVTSLETPTTIDSSSLARGLENDTADSTSNATLKPYQPVLPTDELPRWSHRGAVDAKKVEKNQKAGLQKEKLESIKKQVEYDIQTLIKNTFAKFKTAIENQATVEK